MFPKLVNKLLYKKDKVHWHNDRSSTFLEFVTSGAGDSLDFAAAKYVTLVNLGFDNDRFEFFKTDTNGLSKTRVDTKNYYVLGYKPKNSDKYVVLDCYSDKLLPILKEDVGFKSSEISYSAKLKMEQDMLKINFVRHHQFLEVELKN